MPIIASGKALHAVTRITVGSKSPFLDSLVAIRREMDCLNWCFAEQIELIDSGDSPYGTLFRRRKFCRLAEGVQEIDYKDIATLKKNYITESGKKLYQVVSPVLVQNTSVSWHCYQARTLPVFITLY